MGEVRAKVTLENQRDRILADAGHLEPAAFVDLSSMLWSAPGR
jgi:hypothetical protein